MTVGNYTFNQFALQLGKYQRQANLLVVILLCAYLLAYAAELTWRLLPSPANHQQTHFSQSPAALATKNNTQRANIGSIVALDLFGSVNAAPVAAPVQMSEAPKTRLNLTLTGVVASSDSQAGAAIIENKGAQNTYGLGDKIDGTNAVLTEVYTERVIIKNGARRETLMLDGVDYSKMVVPPSSQRGAAAVTQASAQRRQLSSDAIRAIRNVRKRPSGFSDFIAMSPAHSNGVMQGYRVSPGKDPSLFKSAGLKPGDIVTEINGLDLTDMQQSLEAMAALQKIQSLQMTVNRDNQKLTLFVDIPTKELQL